MPEVAGATDTAIVDLPAILRLVAGGAAVLAAIVVSGVAWLCFTELGRAAKHIGRGHPR